MTPETINSLVNMGAAGAVLAVVIIFIRYIERRDTEWRSFFMEFRKGDNENQTRLAASIDCLTNKISNLQDDIHNHDLNVERRIEVIKAASKGRAPGGVK